MPQVCINACFENLCPGDGTEITGFAIIKLVTPPGYDGLVHNSELDVYYPCDQVWRADVDASGCITTCALPTNDVLNIVDGEGNPLTYYEMAIFINGECCGTEQFLFDSRVNTYPIPPTCVDLADVTITSPPSGASNLFCNLVQQCETPWIGIAGPAIEILPADNPTGGAGNMHQPTIGVKISADPDNDLIIGTDGGLYVNVDTFTCALLATCSINNLGDVDSTGAAPGDILEFDGAQWVVGSKAQVDVLDSPTIDFTITGTGSPANPWEITGEVLLSFDLGNTLIYGTDGALYSPATAVDVVDSDSIDLSISGTGTTSDPFVITSEAIIDTVQTDNALVSGPDGLYVPTPVQITCEEIQDCVGSAFANGLTYDDPSNTMFVDISGDAGNSIVFGSDTGIYSPVADGSETRIVAGACAPGDCANIVITGTGTIADPYVVSTQVNIDPSFDNALTCGPDGLFVPRTSVTVLDTSCIDLSITGVGTIGDPYVISAQPIVDAVSPNNALVCNSAGLYVEAADGSETIVTVLDTNTVDATITGTGTAGDPYVVSGSVILDPDVTNLLVAGPNGLAVLCEDVQDCIGQAFADGLDYDDPSNEFKVDISGDAGNSIIFGADRGIYAPTADGSETKVQVADTACIDLTLIGSGTIASPYIISAAPIVDPAADNTLICGAGGLYVPKPDIAMIVESDTDCIDSTISGSGTVADPYIFSSDIVIDPNVDNIAECLPTGLFVPGPDGSETILQILDGDCIDLSLVGSGTLSNPYVLQADIDISPLAGNAITCTPTGLFVEQTSIEVVDSNCINLSLTGTGTVTDPYIITAEPIVDTVATDNTLTCGVNGLYVPAADGSETIVTVLDTVTVDSTITGTGTVADPYVISSDVLVSAVTDNLLVVLPDGLAVTCEAIQDCVGQGFAEGLDYDDVSNEFKVDISGDAGNIIVFGGDLGVYAPAPDGSETIVTVVDTPCLDLTLTGVGTASDPYVISGAPIISSDVGNAIECRVDGLYAERVTEFEIGQACILDHSPTVNAMWRAPRTGEVTFEIASVPYNGASPDGPTNFEIIDETGAVVYTGVIPVAAGYATFTVGPLPVSPGDGFAARAIAPFPTTPAQGLVVRGEYVS